MRAGPSGHGITPALFGIERDRLGELLAGLGAAEWERFSPCPGWTNLGLCCPGDDLGLLARHRDGYLGTLSPVSAAESEVAGWLDELQDQWVRAARRLSRGSASADPPLQR